MTLTLYPARVGRDPEQCDRCRDRIPPSTLCSQAGNGMLYCQRCAIALSHPVAHDTAHARLLGDRTPETP